MPKSKNRKNHQSQLNKYKSTKKKEQESFKKKMIDNYIKMQQENLANQESHTSTEDVSGPEINIDDLNQIEDWEPNIVDVQPDVVDSNIEWNDGIDIVETSN